MIHCKVSEDTFKKCLQLAHIMNQEGIKISHTKRNPTSFEEFQLLRKMSQENIFKPEFYTGKVFGDAIKRMTVTGIVNELAAAKKSQDDIIGAMEEYGSFNVNNAVIKIMNEKNIHMSENIRDHHKESYRQVHNFRIIICSM